MKPMLILMFSLTAGAFCPAAEPPATRPMQAEMLQTTTAKAVTPMGFAHGKVTLQKGKVFPVVERRGNVVVLDTGGGRVRVSPGEVKVSPRTPALTAVAEVPASVAEVPASVAEVPASVAEVPASVK